jgi:hypothetical protein
VGVAVDRLNDPDPPSACLVDLSATTRTVSSPRWRFPSFRPRFRRIESTHQWTTVRWSSADAVSHTAITCFVKLIRSWMSVVISLLC